MDPVRAKSEKVMDDLYKSRHSLAHVLAQAVLQIRPEAKLAFGPPIENGFYYDFDFGAETALTADDFSDLEDRMRKILKEDQKFEMRMLPAPDAIAHLESRGEKYKVEHCQRLQEKGNAEVSFYRNGPFEDLCEGPHVAGTRSIHPKSFQLDRVSGAYWLGDERRPMLVRIYGLAFATPEELKDFVFKREEAKKRDHRVLGPKMGLFSFHDEGRGFPFYLNNGMAVKDSLIDFWKTLHRRRGYQFISTPTVLNRSLWETSGHWMNYRENMYTLKIDDEDCAVKPMNCPGGILVYGETPKSFRELPLRVAELGHVHRHEKSGVLDGLRRVRAFTQDDAHVFMTPDQIAAEILEVIDLADAIYSTFDLEYELNLSTRPPKSIGSDENWAKAEAGLKNALDAFGKPYGINPGDGAFYGPKIDFMLKDALDRQHQCGTIQLDMGLPERFDLTYVGSDNSPHRVVMIHRALYGSLDRFLGILIEHYAGEFPFWLAPVQARVLPITDEFNDYAWKVHDRLIDAGIRADVNDKSDKIGKKIRDAGPMKIPYLLVVGKKEADSEQVAPRQRSGTELPATGVDAIIAQMLAENDPFHGKQPRWRRKVS
ncbi:MAG TPA: threonine--tRNA ligase [Planctomycetia bacterium]|nr:threonine--tRNA ligase [Planctomycetia bacterium]